MASYNEHTGAQLVSKASTASYVKQHATIFAPKELDIKLPITVAYDFTSKKLEEIVTAVMHIVNDNIKTEIEELTDRLVSSWVMVADQPSTLVTIQVRSTLMDKVLKIAEVTNIDKAVIQDYLAANKVVMDALDLPSPEVSDALRD